MADGIMVHAELPLTGILYRGFAICILRRACCRFARRVLQMLRFGGHVRFWVLGSCQGLPQQTSPRGGGGR